MEELLQGVEGADNPDKIAQFFYENGELNLPESDAVLAPATEPAAEPAVAAKAPEPAAEPATETEPALPENLDDPIKGRISAKQFNATEQKAMRLMHVLNDGKTVDDPTRIDIFEAKARLDAMAAKEKPPEVPQGPTPVEVANTKVTELRSSLADLKAKRTEEVAYGNETSDLDTQIEEAQEAIAEARMEAKLAEKLGERDAKQQQAQAAAQQREREVAARQEAKAAVLVRFPAAADKDSVLGVEVASVISEMNQAGHPDHDVLFAKNAAKFVTTEAMERLADRHKLSYAQAVEKFSGAKAATPAPSAAEPAAPAAPKVTPAAGNARTTPPAAEKSMEDILAEVGDDPDKAIAALYGDNLQTFAR